MKHKYPIDESVLMRKLKEAYGIDAESLCLIPIGDSAYSYRVDGASGEKFYMKLFDQNNDSQRRGIVRLHRYLPLTWMLYHQGLFRNLTYPIKTVTGTFSASLSGCTVALFPFIDGDSLAEAYSFSSRIVEDIAMSAARIHQTSSYIDRSTLEAESYDISFESDLEACISHLERTTRGDDLIQQSLREHVLPKKNQIVTMRNRMRELRSLASADRKEMVLCHGDLWGGNLIANENELYVLDWESAQLAPPELDFMGYIGEDFEVFLAAYERQLGHAVTVNPDILRFYCYRHQLRNLSNWLMNILHRNLEASQKENDLDMIIHHCMNRWDDIEPKMKAVEAVLQKRP